MHTARLLLSSAHRRQLLAHSESHDRDRNPDHREATRMKYDLSC